MHFSAKCNSGRIAIQWFHIKHYLDYQYAKFQPYTFRVQKMCVFARYATLVPRLLLTVPRRCSAVFVDRIINLYFKLIFVMLSSDLNVKKSGPGITMPP